MLSSWHPALLSWIFLSQNVDNILCCQEVQALLHLSTFVHLVALIAIIILTDADKRFKTLRFLMWLLKRPRVDLDTEESLMIIVLESSW